MYLLQVRVTAAKMASIGGHCMRFVNNCCVVEMPGVNIQTHAFMIFIVLQLCEYITRTAS